jgi:hypothetical protein
MVVTATETPGPTRVPDEMVSPPAATVPVAIRVLTPTGWRVVTPAADGSIVVELPASGPGTIRAVAPAPPAANLDWHRICWDVLSPTQEFTITVDPGGVLVWKGPLLMRPVVDYVWAEGAKTFRFTAAQGLKVGDVVQVVYPIGGIVR